MGLARSLGGYVLCLGLGALGVLGPSAVQAQAFLSTEVPAEFPPASFCAAQYVDSRGCVYVRTDARRVAGKVAGLHMGTHYSASGSRRVLLAGPYDNPTELGRTLNRMRSMGFDAATLR